MWKLQNLLKWKNHQTEIRNTEEAMVKRFNFIKIVYKKFIDDPLIRLFFHHFLS